MTIISKSRPQNYFEGVWSESFYITHLIWEMILALHSTNSEQVKDDFLNFLENKSVEIFEINEKLFQIRKEIADVFYKNCPESYNEEWSSFYKEISSFQDKLNTNLMRLFLLKDILLQIDETHPKKSEIEKVFKESFESLLDAKKVTDKITCESEKSFQAVFDAIVIARSINEEISFEEAEKREKKRWE